MERRNWMLSLENKIAHLIKPDLVLFLLREKYFQKSNLALQMERHKFYTFIVTR